MKQFLQSFCLILLLSTFSAAQKTVITGRILGSNNKPMLKAFICHWDMEKNTYLPFSVNADGSFRYESDSKFIRFMFAGVNHRTIQLPIFIDKQPEIRFDILLPAYRYKKSFDDVRIFGNFNSWNSSTTPDYAKSDNGIYSWDIKSDLDTIKYQLFDIGEESYPLFINGTMADTYTYNPDRDVLISINRNNGSGLHIEFDPAKLVRENTEAAINSDMPECPEIKVMKEELKKQIYLQRMTELGLKDSTFLPDLKELARIVKNDLERETDPFVRGYCHFKYLSLLRDMRALSVVSSTTVKLLDSSLLVNALNEISPSSPFWSLNFNYIYGIGSPYSYIDQRNIYDEYIDKVIVSHDDPSVLAEALWAKAEWIKSVVKRKRSLRENPPLDKTEIAEMSDRIIKEYKEKYNLTDAQIRASWNEISKLMGAEYKRLSANKKNKITLNTTEMKTADEDLSKQEDLARECLERIVKEFPNTWRGKMVQKEFVSFRRDLLVPEFEVKLMGESDIYITSSSLKGKYYLLDFWAAWCRPCINNMEQLHEAYKKLKDKNFEIISLSLDKDDDTVIGFRKGKYPMPWLHARLAQGFDDELARKFEVTSIPFMLLISPEGKILANNWDLMGQNFSEKIEKLIISDKH